MGKTIKDRLFTVMLNCNGCEDKATRELNKEGFKYLPWRITSSRPRIMTPTPRRPMTTVMKKNGVSALPIAIVV